MYTYLMCREADRWRTDTVREEEAGFTLHCTQYIYVVECRKCTSVTIFTEILCVFEPLRIPEEMVS